MNLRVPGFLQRILSSSVRFNSGARLLGRFSSGAGEGQEIEIGDGLSLHGNRLDANVRVELIEAEAQAREQAVAEVAGDLSVEAGLRQAGDSALDLSIAAESAARAASVSAEAQARQTGDGTLSAAIASETATRGGQVAGLDGRVTGLENSQAAGRVNYKTFAEMEADTGQDDGTIAEVGALEANPALRGTYQWNATGTEWVKDENDLSGRVTNVEDTADFLDHKTAHMTAHIGSPLLKKEGMGVDWRHVFTDRIGRVLGGFDSEGLLRLLGTLHAPNVSALLAVTDHEELLSPWTMVVTDTGDRVIAGIRRDGSVYLFGSEIPQDVAEQLAALGDRVSILEGSEPVAAAEPICTYIEWAQDPSRDAIVSWHSLHRSSALEYRAAGSPDWFEAQGRTLLFPSATNGRLMHSVHLTGLAANTFYEFRPKYFPESVKKFRTLPRYLSARNLKIIFASDNQESGFATPGHIWEQITLQMGAIEPDLIVAGGDYFGGDGVNSSGTRTHWSNWLALTEQHLTRADGTLVPIAYMVGNHDSFGGDAGGSLHGNGDIPFLPYLFRFLYDSGQPNQSGNGYGYFQVGNELLWVCLDSHHASPLEEQVAWVRGLLERFGDSTRHIILSSHFNPLPLSNSWNRHASRMLRRRIMPMLTDHPRVKVWMTGHDHMIIGTPRLRYQDDETDGDQRRWYLHEDGFRVLGAGGWAAWTAGSSDRHTYLSSIDSSSFVDFAVTQSIIVGTPESEVPELGGTQDEAGPRHFWLLTLSEDEIKAECINYQGNIYKTYTMDVEGIPG